MKNRQTGRQKTVELEERTTKYQDTRGQHDRKTGHQKYKKTGGQGDSKTKGLEERISADTNPTTCSTHCHCCNFLVSLKLAYRIYQGQKSSGGARRRTA